eukprot:7389359-Prymnesium_polylepis.1
MDMPSTPRSSCCSELLSPKIQDPFNVMLKSLVDLKTANKTALADFEARWGPESFILAARRWIRQALTHAHFHVRDKGNSTHGARNSAAA